MPQQCFMIPRDFLSDKRASERAGVFEFSFLLWDHIWFSPLQFLYHNLEHRPRASDRAGKERVHPRLGPMTLNALKRLFFQQ